MFSVPDAWDRWKRKPPRTKRELPNPINYFCHSIDLLSVYPVLDGKYDFLVSKKFLKSQKYLLETT